MTDTLIKGRRVKKDAHLVTRGRKAAAGMTPSGCRSPGPRGFTLLEVLITVGIMVIVMALVMAALLPSRRVAKAATCINNLHQIHTGMRSLMADQANRVPHAFQVMFEVRTYIGDDKVYRCPEVTSETAGSYAVNPCIGAVQRGSKIVMMDANPRCGLVFYEGGTEEEFREMVATRHPQETTNVLFFDGSVGPHTFDEINPYASAKIKNEMWEPEVPCDGSGSGGGAGGSGGCGLCALYYHDHWVGVSAMRQDATLSLPFGSANFGGVPNSAKFTPHAWNIPLDGCNTSGWHTGCFGSGTWSGQIKADVTGDYTFHLACDNEAWLYINGSEVIWRNTGGAVGVTTFQASDPFPMTAGEWIDIEVRLKELTPGSSPSHIYVEWEGPGVPRGDIPCANLRPG